MMADGSLSNTHTHTHTHTARQRVPYSNTGCAHFLIADDGRDKKQLHKRHAVRKVAVEMNMHYIVYAWQHASMLLNPCILGGGG